VKSKKAREVRQAPIWKGFREDRKRDHWYYFLYIGGRRSAIYTKISHNEPEIGTGLLSVMARQLRIGTAGHCDQSRLAIVRLLFLSVRHREAEDKPWRPAGRATRSVSEEDNG
jgi:hypothetical protein